MGFFLLLVPKRVLGLFAVIVLVGAFVPLVTPLTDVAAEPASGVPEQALEGPAGEVLVTFKEVLSRGQALQAARGLSANLSRTLPAASQTQRRTVAVLKARAGEPAAVLAARLRRDPAVLHASPNYRISLAALFPNDAYFARQWALNNTGQTVGQPGKADADIDAPEAWQEGTGSREPVAVVLDTGIDYRHPDLAPNIWVNPGEIAGNGLDDDGNGYIDDLHGVDIFNGDADPMDDHGHGSHVAGIIGAVGNNARGVAGVAWNARLLPVKIFDSSGEGTLADAAEGLSYVTRLKLTQAVNVVAANASWSGKALDPTLYEAVLAARDAGIFVVAAAGNEHANNDTVAAYPASFNLDNVIAVAATDNSDALASFSNYGAQTVDLAAPGVTIISSIPTPHPPTPGDPFFTNHEGDSTGWLPAGGWALSTQMVYSPTQAWSDSPGSYKNNTTADLTGPVIDLSAAPAQLVLSFRLRYDLEWSFDFLHVELSADGGSSWRRVSSITGSTYGQWVVEEVGVPPGFASAAFRFRFRLSTDESVTDDGVHLDDLALGVRSPTGEGYAYMSGTSMAAPHVTGALVLDAATRPADTLLARRSRLLSAVDPLTGLAGKVVTGGRLNLARLLANAAPQVVSLSPTPSTIAAGASRIFTAAFRDADGATDLTRNELLFGVSTSDVNAVRVYYDEDSNEVGLLADDGTTWLTGAAGSAATLSNNRVSLPLSGVAVTRAGTDLTLNASLTFKAAFAGIKKVWLAASDSRGSQTGWVEKGQVTVTASALAPQVVSLSPASAMAIVGTPITFTARYSDANGAANLKSVRLLFNSSLSTSNGVYLYYDEDLNRLYLRNADNISWSSGVPGTSTIIQNIRASIPLAGVSVSKVGNELTLRVPISFTSLFMGTKFAYLQAQDDGGLSTSWTQKGSLLVRSDTTTTTARVPTTTTTAPPPPTTTTAPPSPTTTTAPPSPTTTTAPPSPAAPQVVSLSPASAMAIVGTPITFTARYSDANGAANLKSVRLLFNSSLSTSNGVYLYYDEDLNRLYLRNADNISWSSGVPGTSTIIQNIRASIPLAGVSVSKVGNELTLRVPISFTSLFIGTKFAYLQAQDDGGLSTSWTQKGSVAVGVGWTGSWGLRGF